MRQLLGSTNLLFGQFFCGEACVPCVPPLDPPLKIILVLTLITKIILTILFISSQNPVLQLACPMVTRGTTESSLPMRKTVPASRRLSRVILDTHWLEPVQPLVIPQEIGLTLMELQPAYVNFSQISYLSFKEHYKYLKFCQLLIRKFI